MYAHTFLRDQAPTFRNITITGNTFNRSNDPVIALSGVDSGLITNNHFSGSRNPVQLNRCTNVIVRKSK